MSDREQRLEDHGRFYAETGIAVAWTVGIEGEEAKRCGHGWNGTEPLRSRNFSASYFRSYGRTHNPCIVMRNSGLVGIETDDAKSLELYDSLRLPATLTARSSGEDRFHFYFIAPPDCPYAVFRLEGGEVRGVRDAYFVAPPALHPSGAEYRFITEMDEPTELTQDQYDRVEAMLSEQQRERGTQLAADPEARILPGGRRHEIFRAACSMQARGFPAEAIMTACHAMNEARCDPPLERSQVEAQVQSAVTRYPAGTAMPTRDTPWSDTEPHADDGQQELSHPRFETVRLVDALREAQAIPEEDGIPVPSADYVCFRMVGGRLYSLGGYPGDGKTSLALQAVISTARMGGQLRNGGRSLIVTLEMSRHDVARRVVQIAEGADWRSIPPESVGSWDVYLCEDPATQVAELMRYQPYDLVVVDHVHLMGFDDRREIERIIAAMKRLSIDHNVPVLLLGQLRDDPDFHRPRMNQFRETRMFEANSDMVAMVWRERDDQGQPSELAELLIRKDRYGEPRIEELMFEGRWTRFVQRPTTRRQYEPDAYTQSHSQEDVMWEYEMGGGR